MARARSDKLERDPGAGVFRTVRSRMLFYILAVIVPIYAAALYMSYHATEQPLKVEA